MATLFLDLEGGSDGADGTSFANRKKTLAGASAIAQPGDIVRIMASTTPNSLSVNGTFAKGCPKITLASSVNATIDNGESAWTASANVTCTTSTTRKQGATSTSIAVASGFTTGLAAYKDIGGATDFSGYQQLSFWFQQTAGTLGGFDIKLCSDAVGATPVDTFSVPAAVTLNGWNRVTINLGSAMGSSIQSVAFYVTTDNGAQTYLIDNMVACKAPGTGELSHKTLIGKANSLGAGGNDSETWYAIRAIEDTTVTIDLLNSSSAGSTTNGRYWGVSETVTAYSLFPSYLPTSVASADVLWLASGTDQATLTISGGWNRTDMSTQTSQTWIATSHHYSSLAPIFQCSYVALSKLNYAMLIGSTPTFNNMRTTITTCHVVSCVGAQFQGTGNTYTGIVVANPGSTTTLAGFNSTISVSVFTDTFSVGMGNAFASTLTIDPESVFLMGSVLGNSTLAFNGTTYGSFGDASTAAAVMASSGDTSITLTKALEMLAAFIAGKVSVSSAGGVSTYTYKKRDGTTTSFTALCSEVDGTRATTGALS